MDTKIKIHHPNDMVRTQVTSSNINYPCQPLINTQNAQL